MTDDPDLAAIVAAWPSLAEAARAGFLNLIRGEGVPIVNVCEIADPKHRE